VKGILVGGAVLLGGLLLGLPDARGQLFEADSKRLGSPRWTSLVKEVERRDRASVLEVKITTLGSSVGSSLFIACSVRELARQRGARHVVKLDDRPKRGQMLVGFLSGPDESPAAAGPEFEGLSGNDAVLDVEQFAPICPPMREGG
jgi:hypothetical protein